MSVKSEGKEKEQVELIQDNTDECSSVLYRGVRSDVPEEFRSAAM